MLDINMEFHKGVLFVRLRGKLNQETVSKLKNEVIDVIKDSGISNMVYNLANLKEIDCYGISNLLESYHLCKNNHGKLLLCNINDNTIRYRINDSHILNYKYEASDELSAINIINL